jgi:PKD repeat protein
MNDNHSLTAFFVEVPAETIDHPIEVGGITFHVTTESNSSVSDFSFNQTLMQISFNVTGLEGTVGFCNVTIPKDLLGDPFTVLINDTPLPYELTENATHYFLYVTYNHSTNVIQIIGTTAATPPIASFTHSPSEPVVDETVTFNASESHDPDGSITSYSWDFGDGTPVVTESDPIATHVYAAADTYTVTLTITDNDGLANTTVATVTVSLAPMDVTPPTITINEPTARDYLHSEAITLDFSAVDTESGVASITATLNEMTVENGETIEVYTLPLGEHMLIVTAVDNAGNSDTKTVTFNVIATIDSLIALVEKFHDLGYINDGDFKNGLLAKLYAAKAKIETGQAREAKNYLKTARNILNAFINQVKADDHVAAEAASILISDVEYVQNNL